MDVRRKVLHLGQEQKLQSIVIVIFMFLILGRMRGGDCRRFSLVAAVQQQTRLFVSDLAILIRFIVLNEIFGNGVFLGDVGDYVSYALLCNGSSDLVGQLHSRVSLHHFRAHDLSFGMDRRDEKTATGLLKAPE